LVPYRINFSFGKFGMVLILSNKIFFILILNLLLLVKKKDLTRYWHWTKKFQSQLMSQENTLRGFCPVCNLQISFTKTNKQTVLSWSLLPSWCFPPPSPDLHRYWGRPQCSIPRAKRLITLHSIAQRCLHNTCSTA